MYHLSDKEKQRLVEAIRAVYAIPFVDDRDDCRCDDWGGPDFDQESGPCPGPEMGPTKKGTMWHFGLKAHKGRIRLESDLKLTTKQFSVDFIACTSKILGNIGYNRAQGADMHVPMTRNRHPVFGALSGSSQHHVTAFLPDEPVAILTA